MAPDEKDDALSEAEVRALDPSTRRLVLVATDEKYGELVAALDWKKAGASIAAALVLGPLVSTAVTSGLVVSAAARGAEGVRRGFERARAAVDRSIRRGAIPLPRLHPENARRSFRFAPGEPQDGSVYLIHPDEPDRYLLPATAPLELAREKIALLSLVAARLGARRVTVVGVESQTSLFRGALRVPIPKLAVALGFDASKWTAGDATRHVVREYERPAGPPSVPEELRAAIERDPELRALVRERLEHGLARARTTITFREESGVSPDLVAEIASRGLRVGTSDVQRVASSWTFEVEFWAM